MKQPSTPFDLRQTPEYREFGFQIVVCPNCGMETLDSHWICTNCGWEYDGAEGERKASPCNPDY